MKIFNKKNLTLKCIKGKIKKYKVDLIIISLFSLIIIKSLQSNPEIRSKLGRYNGIFPDTENFWKINKKSFDYLKRTYGYLLNDLPTYQHTHQTNKTIFWCWLQGIQEAPKLYISNLYSLKMNCKDFNIIIINETNMYNYIKFPTYIIEKYKKKYFSRSHFSDLLRLELLIKYGGTWIDASVLITKYVKEYFTKDLFFFQERGNDGYVGSSWFITSEKGSPILRTTRDLLYEYWRNNYSLYNYFTFHIFFKMSCEIYIQDLKNVQYISNVQPHILQSKLREKFSQEKFNKIINNVTVHKLTFPISNITKNSFFHYIINKYFKK